MSNSTQSVWKDLVTVCGYVVAAFGFVSACSVFVYNSYNWSPETKNKIRKFNFMDWSRYYDK